MSDTDTDTIAFFQERTEHLRGQNLPLPEVGMLVRPCHSSAVRSYRTIIGVDVNTDSLGACVVQCRFLMLASGKTVRTPFYKLESFWGYFMECSDSEDALQVSP